MVIKKTRSLCPVCGAVLEAEIVEEEGKIWLVRTCPEHGKFRHCTGPIRRCTTGSNITM